MASAAIDPLPPQEPIDEEPRVLDTDLAEALGMAEPRFIRANVIEPGQELEAYGSLIAKNSNPRKRGGRPGRAFCLNEEQALLVCLLSCTEKAKTVRAMIGRVQSHCT